MASGQYNGCCGTFWQHNKVLPKKSEFQVHTASSEWSLILPIVAVQTYDKLMYSIIGKGFWSMWPMLWIDWKQSSSVLHLAFSQKKKKSRMSDKPSRSEAKQSVIDLKLLENYFLVICKWHPESWKKQNEDLKSCCCCK